MIGSLYAVGITEALTSSARISEGWAISDGPVGGRSGSRRGDTPLPRIRHLRKRPNRPPSPAARPMRPFLGTIRLRMRNHLRCPNYMHPYHPRLLWGLKASRSLPLHHWGDFHRCCKLHQLLQLAGAGTSRVDRRHTSKRRKTQLAFNFSNKNWTQTFILFIHAHRMCIGNIPRYITAAMPMFSPP